MSPEYQNLVEKQKAERIALSQRHQKEMADLKVRHEQQKSQLRQAGYAVKEGACCDTSMKMYVPDFASFNEWTGQ